MLPEQQWSTRIIDANDGRGNSFLPLPDDLCAQLGWTEDTVVDVSVSDSGKLIIRRVDPKSNVCENTIPGGLHP